MRLSGETKGALIRLGVEMALYALLVVAYLYLVLTFMGPQLTRMFKQNLGPYAVIALVLMVFQGVFLESLTTFLIDRLGL